MSQCEFIFVSGTLSFLMIHVNSIALESHLQAKNVDFGAKCEQDLTTHRFRNCVSPLDLT